MRSLFIILSLLVSTAYAQYPIKNQLGVNVHEWDLASHPQQAGKEARTAALQNAIISTGFTWLRLYADATVKKDATNTTFMFSPDGRGYEADLAISQLKARNPSLRINYCYQNQPKNIQTEWQATGKRSTQYRHPNTDPLQLSTWSELAKDMAVIAGRGGKNTLVPDYPLFTPANWWETQQQMLKGSGLYDQIESGNEYDNGYSNNIMTNGQLVEPEKPALTGEQYATIWKACYDAAKKADPNILVSTTGVMTEDPQILIDALAYARSKGWGSIFDKYHFHCYPWGWAKNIASALPPEYNMYPAAKKVVAAANGIPSIIGEWGFDLHPDSDMGVRPPLGYTGEQFRSYLITRSLLLFSVAGIESSFYYRMYQDYGLANDNNSTIFETSSLFIKDDNDNITRRLSGDVFKQIGQFGDFVFDSTIVEDDTKRVYRFKNGTQKMFTGWTVEKVELVTVPNGAWTTNRAKFTEVKANHSFPAGNRYDIQLGDTMSRISFPGGNIELSSKPVFIVVGDSVARPVDTIVTPPPVVIPPQDTVVVPPPPIPPAPVDTVVRNFKGEWYHMEVYNIAGQLIGKYYTNNPKQVKNRLPRGIYIIKYYNDRNFFTEKYIKN